MSNGNSMADTQVQIAWSTTDPDKSIELSKYLGYTDTSPAALITTYRNFFGMLSQPDRDLHDKNGPSFLIGPCRGRRAAKNIPKAFIAVIDGDKSIDENNEYVEGAPPPLAVHEALVSWNISHAIYTTYSHGIKGNRFRIAFPMELKDKQQLKAYVTYFTELLQSVGIRIALAAESCVWGQGWHLPRIAYEGANFFFQQHFGVLPDPEDLVEHYGYRREQAHIPPPLHAEDSDAETPIGLVGKCMPIQWQLDQKGYSFESQGVMMDQHGKEVPVMRFKKPGSESAAGVIVFNSGDKWRAYSHHGGDPLNNGHSNDAFDVFMLLNDIGDSREALELVVPAIQEHIDEELNKNYPSVLEGGTKFRFGSSYVDDFGASSFKMLDLTSFQAVMSNQSGVPTLIMDKEGRTAVQMQNRFEYWRNSRNRVMYNGTTYEPCAVHKKPSLIVTKSDDKPYFNLFRTWHIKPIKGRWPLLEWHLKNTICGGNPEEYEYLLNWFSHLFQFPNEKPQVAIILQGGRGWGKTLLFSEIAKKMGTHSIVVGNNRLLTGNFNSHMRNKLMMVVEESFWSGNHKDRGVLQHLISDSITAYEKKGYDAEVGQSFLRVVMISNEDWVAPVATDERRYFLPTLSDASYQEDIKNGYKGNFFPRLAQELRNGGLEAFVDYVGGRSFDVSSIKQVPQTTKFHQQKHLSLDWLDQWFMSAMEEGRITSKAFGPCVWTEKGCAIPSEQLQASLMESAPGSVSYSNKGFLTVLGQRITKSFGRGFVKRVRAGDGVVYMFDALTDCRRQFELYVKSDIDWTENQPITGTSEQREHHEYRH